MRTAPRLDTLHTVCLKRTEDYICHAQGLRGQAIHHTHTHADDHATWQFQPYMLCALDLESLKMWQKLYLTDLIDYCIVHIKRDCWKCDF